ncbi:MAG TPA: STAS domain-containing protein [Thermoleophilaceae bacterium]
MLATLRLELGSETPVARLAGEVDASNAPGFTTELKQSVPNTAVGLVLDLTDTTYIDSSGIHLIFDLADALRRRQQTLALVVAPETFVADVLGAVSLAGAASVSPTVADAQEAVRRPAF